MRRSAFALSAALHLAPFVVPFLMNWLHADADPPAQFDGDQGRVKKVVSVALAMQLQPGIALTGEGPKGGSSMTVPDIGSGVRREFVPASMSNIFKAARHWGARLRVADYPYSTERTFAVLFCNPERFQSLQGLYESGQIVTYEFPIAFQIELDRKAQAWAGARGLQGEVRVIRAAFTAKRIPYFEITEVFLKDTEPSACSGN